MISGPFVVGATPTLHFLNMKPLSAKLIKKIEYYKSLKEYGGCFTPDEIITLIDNGAKPCDINYIYYKELIKKGKGGNYWFYFWLNSKELKEKFGQRNKQHHT